MRRTNRVLALRVSYDALVSCLRIGGDRHQVGHFDLPSELGNGHPGILLQESQYLDIYFVGQQIPYDSYMSRVVILNNQQL